MSCAACGAALIRRGWHPIEGEEQGEVARPRVAQAAVYLLYAALLPNLAQAALLGSVPVSVPALLSAALLTGFSALLIYHISRGSNWARMSYLVVFIFSCLSLPSLLEALDSATGAMLAMGSAGLIASLFELSALIMLFSSASNDWFRGGEPHLPRHDAAPWRVNRANRVNRVNPSRPEPPPPSNPPPPPA